MTKLFKIHSHITGVIKRTKTEMCFPWGFQGQRGAVELLYKANFRKTSEIYKKQHFAYAHHFIHFQLTKQNVNILLVLKGTFVA